MSEQKSATKCLSVRKLSGLLRGKSQVNYLEGTSQLGWALGQNPEMDTNGSPWWVVRKWYSLISLVVGPQPMPTWCNLCSEKLLWLRLNELIELGESCDVSHLRCSVVLSYVLLFGHLKTETERFLCYSNSTLAMFIQKLAPLYLQPIFTGPDMWIWAIWGLL